MSKKVRVGIIGLGDHCSQSHIKYLLQMTDICQIIAVCDLQVEKAQKVCKELNVPDANDLYYHGTFEDLIKNDKVDAVFIMTPDPFHTQQLVASVEAGKHVFCEKPLASTKDEYEQLVKAFTLAVENKLIVTTCHPRRFDAPFETLRDWIHSGAELEGIHFGKVLHFDFNFQYHAPSKQGLHTSLMFDHLNHEVDAMHYLFGIGEIQQATKNFDSETQFNVTGTRKDGITFSFVGQRKLQERIYPEYMRILFEKGFIDIDLFMGKARFVGGDGSDVTHTNPILYKTGYEKRFTAINKNFLQTILGTEKPYITQQEMLINTQLAIDLHQNKFVEYA